MPDAGGLTLVTFDVDGTLIRTVGQDANRRHRDAFGQAWKDVFGVEADVNDFPTHGSTDGLILCQILAHFGVRREDALRRLPEMERVMNDYVLSGQNTQDVAKGLEVLRGVRELLVALQRRFPKAVLVGLGTGNLEPIAWAKMRALDLDSLFSEPRVGGFGSDFCDGTFDQDGLDRNRGELLKAARARAEGIILQKQRVADGGEVGGAASNVMIARHVHVGDAPADMKAAVLAGAKPVGVLTGIFDRETLTSACQGSAVGWTVLDSLEDTEAALQAILETAASPGSSNL